MPNSQWGGALLANSHGQQESTSNSQNSRPPKGKSEKLSISKQSFPRAAQRVCSRVVAPTRLAERNPSLPCASSWKMCCWLWDP